MNIVCTFLGKTKSVTVPYTMVTIGRKSSKGTPELDLEEDKYEKVKALTSRDRFFESFPCQDQESSANAHTP